MSVDAAIRRARRRERRMWRCVGRLTRPSDTSTFDEDTGDETAAAGTLIYEGPCQVRAQATSGRRDAQAGEREIRIDTLRGKLPPDTEAAINDVLEVTDSKYDLPLIGRKFRVTDVLRDDWQVVCTVILEEVTPP